MKFNLETASLCLAFSGSVVLAYGFISKGLGASQKIASMYLGSNPFAIKDLYYGRWEAIMGVALLFLAFLCTLLAKQFPEVGFGYGKSHLSSVLHIAVPFAAVIFVFLIAVWAGDVVAYHNVKGFLLDHQTQRFERDRSVYWNKGLDKHEIERPSPPQPDESTKSERLKTAMEGFNDLEDLFELSKEGSWDERVRRLEQFFERNKK